MHAPNTTVWAGGYATNGSSPLDSSAALWPNFGDAMLTTIAVNASLCTSALTLRCAAFQAL
jgi:hypothetical protein